MLGMACSHVNVNVHVNLKESNSNESIQLWIVEIPLHRNKSKI